MRIWLVEISDFLPKIDKNNRLYRAGMLARALVDASHHVLWWSSTFNHQLRYQRFNTSKTIEVEKKYHLRLLYGPGYSRSISLRRLKHNRVVAKEFASEIASKPDNELPNLIYACLPTLEVSEQAVIFGVQHGIPVVVDIRDQWPDIYLSFLPRFLHPLMRIILKTDFVRAHKILSKATAITGVSAANLEWGLRLARREASSKDKWFPLGFPKQKDRQQDRVSTVCLSHRPDFRSDCLIVSFIGSFSATCNFRTVVDAARIFYESGDTRIQFVFVGDGARASFLRRSSERIKNIFLIGWSEKQRVDEILLASSVGLAPYAGKAPQTLPNKPFEYMSAGLPILSSLEGELKNIIEQEGIGLHYNASDPYDLKDKIIWFLSHSEERRVMGQKAKALFEKKYNEDIVYSGLVKYLSKIASEGVLNK